METSSALLVLLYEELPVIVGFSSRMANNEDIWRFLLRKLKPAVEHTIDMPVI